MTDSEKIDLILSELQGMKQRMQSMEQEMQSMKQEMQSMKQEMQSMEQEIQSMKQEMQSMKQEMQSMKQEIQTLKQDVSDIKQKVTRTDLTMENELRVNIKRVAEGHLDLSRNLHAAMKPSNEVEMLAVRVGVLESDVSDIKAKLA